MNPVEIQTLLTARFGEKARQLDPDSYQIDTPDYRLLVIFSAEQSWVRMLVPIAPAAEAMTFIEEFLAANFDDTLETRYALHQGVLWGVWQHSVSGLTSADFSTAIDRILELKQVGIDRAFRDFATKQVREIVKIAKQRGDTLAQTMQTLDRFYAEGIMGDLGTTEAVRQEMMTAWRYQLERLWSEAWTDCSLRMRFYDLAIDRCSRYNIESYSRNPMARQLKRWESPRKEGRNDKGKGGSARQRQIKKRNQMLRNKLKENGSDNSKNNQPKKGENHDSLPFLMLLEM